MIRGSNIGTGSPSTGALFYSSSPRHPPSGFSGTSGEKRDDDPGKPQLVAATTAIIQCEVSVEDSFSTGPSAG
jgi:hypothetical protein